MLLLSSQRTRLPSENPENEDGFFECDDDVKYTKSQVTEFGQVLGVSSWRSNFATWLYRHAEKVNRTAPIWL
jgi:hypothetical protein